MIRHLSARPIMKESAGAKAESVDLQLAAALRLAAPDPSALTISPARKLQPTTSIAWPITTKRCVAEPQPIITIIPRREHRVELSVRT